MPKFYVTETVTYEVEAEDGQAACDFVAGSDNIQRDESCVDIGDRHAVLLPGQSPALPRWIVKESRLNRVTYLYSVSAKTSGEAVKKVRDDPSINFFDRIAGESKLDGYTAQKLGEESP